jgi:2-polyprenyl-3-methyl-5-hydroxy-6-metoxy-1,4-benzoquinol methylase
MATLRERAFAHYDAQLLIAQGSEKYCELTERLYIKNWLPHLPKEKDAAILDLGCGFGFFLMFLKKQGYLNFHGVDISGPCVERCRRQGIDVVQGDVEEYLHDRRESFDCICANHVIEHYSPEEGLQLLDLICGALRKGGRVIVATPNSSNSITAGRSRYFDITHATSFTENSLLFMLELAGFTDIQVLPIDIYVLRNPFLNLLGRMGASAFYTALRLLYLLNGVTSSKVFSKNMLCVGRKI